MERERENTSDNDDVSSCATVPAQHGDACATSRRRRQ